MRCPLCHSEDTYYAQDYLCCNKCMGVFNVYDKLDKIRTDFELRRLVRDVERGVNRP